MQKKFNNNIISRINVFKGVLLKKGNKERIFKYLLKISKYLKNPKNIVGVPKALKTKPTLMIESALDQCSPIFTYKRIVKSGRLYEIPVPISMNRATFIASSWIQKIAKKKTNEGASSHIFIGNEIVNILKKKGGALEQLHNYTSEGIEKNIFKKLIRKKFPTVSRSKNLNAYKAILGRINKSSRKQKFVGKGKKTTFLLMKLKKKHKARNYQHRERLKRKKMKKSKNQKK